MHLGHLNMNNLAFNADLFVIQVSIKIITKANKLKMHHFEN